MRFVRTDEVSSAALQTGLRALNLQVVRVAGKEVFGLELFNAPVKFRIDGRDALQFSFVQPRDFRADFQLGLCAPMREGFPALVVLAAILVVLRPLLPGGIPAPFRPPAEACSASRS